MEEDFNPFKKAGIVLLTIGLIDIGLMAYCIANKISYSSSFNIFAVIAGIYLIKGGVKTARFIRWLSAFLVVAFTGMLLLTPATTPIGLIIAQLKINTAAHLTSSAFVIAVIALFVWVYLQLSSPESLSLLEKAGYKTCKPKSAFIAAGVLATLGSVLYIWLMNGDSAHKAKELAENKLGPEYQYHITHLTIIGDSGRAIVTAFTNSEIRYVQVQW